MLQGNTKTAIKTSGYLSMLKKVGITACIGLSLTITTVHADQNDTLEEIYHVYVDGKHIGKIDDKTVIKNVMESKIEEREKDYDGFSVTIGEEVSFVPERVFSPAYNNHKVSSQLRDDLSVKAEAVELKIADQSVGYFKDQETAEDVLETYKAKYIDEDILKNLSAKENSNPEYKQQALTNEAQKDISLDAGDAVVTDVTLSENVSFSKQKVAPSDVLTEKQGLNMLEKGTLEDKVHTVNKGEVLGDIAGKYDLTVDELLDLNDDLNEDSILQIGQEVHVTDYEPFVDVIVKKRRIEGRNH